MDNVENKSLIGMDFSYTDRQKLLKKSFTGAPLVKSNVWMNDVSGTDRRSIKAQLAGTINARVIWWNTFSKVHQAVSKSGTLEAAMYDFHRMHHALTLFGLKFCRDLKNLTVSIKTDGLAKASKDHLQSVVKEMK